VSKTINTDVRSFLQRAVDIARDHMHGGQGGPFGAVVVENGTIIAEGFNQVTSCNDPTAHAEVVAIREACKAKGTFDLSGCEIYASCEPCPMCLAAIYWARLDRIYYANTRDDAARIDFDDSMIYDEVAKSPRDRNIPMTHVPLDDALAVFDEWARKEDKIPY
jgi:tRNA(Arg) A34 adenosine deaminase TadA